MCLCLPVMMCVSHCYVRMLYKNLYTEICMLHYSETWPLHNELTLQWAEMIVDY